MELSNYSMGPPDSPRGSYQSVDVSLTREAKSRAVKKAHRISRWFVGLSAFSFGITQSLPLFFFLATVTLAVNLIAWRYYLKIEREAATELALHARSLDEE
jgi:hypothetical protein